MSHLEKLPTELLETVFLYCLNINLPRSSPIIGAKLSSKLIYTRTLLSAFGPTWDRYYGMRRIWSETNERPPLVGPENSENGDLVINVEGQSEPGDPTLQVS